MRIVLWDAPGKLRSYSPLKFFISPCVCTLARCARKLSLCAGPGHTWRLIKHARISQDSIKPHEKNSQTGYFRHRGQCREGSQRHRVKINIKYGHDQVPLYMTFCSRMPRPLMFIRPCIHFQMNGRVSRSARVARKPEGDQVHTYSVRPGFSFLCHFGLPIDILSQAHCVNAWFHRGEKSL